MVPGVASAATPGMSGLQTKLNTLLHCLLRGALEVSVELGLLAPSQTDLQAGVRGARYQTASLHLFYSCKTCNETPRGRNPHVLCGQVLLLLAQVSAATGAGESEVGWFGPGGPPLGGKLPANADTPRVC